MKQRIQNIILALALAVTGGLALTPATTFAADCPPGTAQTKCDACEGVNALNGSTSKTCDPNAGTSVETVISNIIQLLSLIVGLIAVIMVIVGGLKYITANGDSGALTSARNTIIYALIGAVIVAVAQVLVHFVLRKATKP
jgi:hypothetical protein